MDNTSPTFADVQAGRYDLVNWPLLLYVAADALSDENVLVSSEYYLDEVANVLPPRVLLPTACRGVSAGA